LSKNYSLAITQYDLYFDIDYMNLKFEGVTTIALNSEGDVQLDLNSSNLVTKVEANGAPVKFSQRKDELTIASGPFRGLLKVFYSGTITDELVGLYRAAYDNTYILSTQLEATNARRMFPCIDHPAYKAEFTLKIRIDADLDAISNMPVQSVEKQGGKKKTITFQKTPKMSTYLLYLGVGHFDEIREKTGGLEIIAATTPGKAETGRFAMDVAQKSIAYYEPYFGIPFPLPKIHLVCVPEFAMGAMENWGAVSFRETAFQVSSKSSIRTHKRVATVVAHELGHMWFGNLVTFKWWSDLWLNESFATFMEYKVVDSAFPQWRIWEDFLRNESATAMRKDCLLCTHPIEVDVKSPDEIEQIFDDISYSKGASIIRMIEDYMGPENFRKGLGAYLNRYSYSNAEGENLWDTLSAFGKEVKTVVNAWIRKPGYPALEVAVKGSKLMLRQKRFLLSGRQVGEKGQAGKEGEKDLWPIPVTLKKDGETQHLLIDREEVSIDATDLVSLVVNVDRVGFYKVFYRGCYDLFWNAETSEIDRWGVVSDAFSFLFEGSLSMDEYLTILERYQDTQELLLAQEISDQLSLLYLLMPPVAKELSVKFHRSQLKILGKSNDENSIMFLATVARRLSMIDDGYAKELGSKFLKFEEVEPNMKESVAVAFARGYGDFDAILKRFRASSSDEERVWLINAMVSFKDPSLVSRSFELASSGEIKRQDVRTMLVASAGNRQARDAVWAWMKANMDKLRAIYKSTGILALVFPAIIPVIGTGKSEVAQYFSEHPMPEAERGILVGLEMLSIYDRFVSAFSERGSA